MPVPSPALRRRTSGLEVREIGDDRLVYDLDTDVVHHLGPVASRVWLALDTARTTPELAALSGCSEDEAADAVHQLADAGLLVGVSRRAFLAKGAALGGAALLTSLPSPALAAVTSQVTGQVQSTVENPPTVPSSPVDPDDLPVDPASLTTVYDPYVDFSSAANPSHGWAYGTKAAPFGNVYGTWTSTYTTGGFTYWSSKRHTDALRPSNAWTGTNPGAYAGKLLLYPSPTAESARLTWTVPTDGSFSGRLTFRYENPAGATFAVLPNGTVVGGSAAGGDGVTVAVFRGDSTPVLPATVLSPSAPTVGVDISGSAFAGQKYHFVVYATISGNNVNDLVSLSGSITVTG